VNCGGAGGGGNVGGYSNPSGGEAVQGFGVRWRGCCGLGWPQGAATDNKGGLAASACGSPGQWMPRIPRVRCGSSKSGVGVASRGT
jgi:hypothetical protein